MSSSGSLLRMQDTLRSGHEGHMSVLVFFRSPSQTSRKNVTSTSNSSSMIGARRLRPESLVMSFGYKPALAEGAVKCQES